MLKVSLIGFMLVFSLISYSIANQSYAGIALIKNAVEEYNIPHKKILTNYWLISYMFEESDIHVIQDSNITRLTEKIIKENYDCVIVWHHNRGVVYQFSDEAIEFFKLNYEKSIKLGSNFSYVEIFYK
jgi:hypothetical protein